MRCRTLAITLSCTALCVGNAEAQEADFRGKTINFIVSFEAGGPYDSYARLVAQFLGPHLPGNPSVVVRNMAGAGGLVGANYLYNVAPRDGTAMGVVSQTVAIGQALATAPGIKYDVLKASWLGRINSNVEVEHALTRSGFTKIDDAKGRAIPVAGTGPTSSSVIFPNLLNELTGTKFKIVTGYQGPRSATLAMERGEVAATVMPWSSIKVIYADALQKHEVSLLVQYTRARHAELQDVPAVVELAQNEEQRQLLGFFASGSALGTSILAPPGLPAATLRTLRRGVAETIVSPELQTAARSRNQDLDFMSGADLEKVVADTFDVTPQVLSQARTLTEAIGR